jgi:SNF2 family DNA or RNA helicase
LFLSFFAGSVFFPSPAEMVRDCGKMALLDRLLNRLLPGGHKVLIFSQVGCTFALWV